MLLLQATRSKEGHFFGSYILRFFERMMITSVSYFVPKFGWQEGWVNDYNKVTG